MVKRVVKRVTKRMVLAMVWNHLKGWFGHPFQGCSQGPALGGAAVRKRPQNLKSLEKFVVGN